MRGSQRGYSLIELMISLVVIAVVMSIMIPNLLNARHRGAQKRTMADIRTLGTAVEAYRVDNSFCPVAADFEALVDIIKPTYIIAVPETDGWGRTFTAASTQPTYTLGSGGRDGGGLTYIGGPTTHLDDAIIFVNGDFVQWPQGRQE
jgi:general secretion pathway protein G